MGIQGLVEIAGLILRNEHLLHENVANKAESCAPVQHLMHLCKLRLVSRTQLPGQHGAVFTTTPCSPSCSRFIFSRTMTTLSASDLLQHTCSYYASEDEDEACPTQEIIKGAMEGCDRCALGEACIRWIRSQSLEVKLSERLLDESSDVREVLVKPDGTVDINGLAKLEILKMNRK